MPPGAALHLGSCFHKSQASNFKQKATTRKNLPTEAIVNEFKASWDLGINRIKFEKDEKPKQIRDKGIDLTAKYHEELSKKWQPTLIKGVGIVEYPLNFKVKEMKNEDEESEELEVTGTIDLLREDMRIVDHKSAGRKWQEGREKSEFQAYMYPFGMMHQGFDIKGFDFGIGISRVLKSGFKTETDVRPVPYDELIASSYIRIALRIADMMRKECPLPNTSSFWCSWKYCGWFNRCEFGGKKKVYSLPQIIKSTEVEL
jgi:hypothetical protein